MQTVLVLTSLLAVAGATWPYLPPCHDCEGYGKSVFKLTKPRLGCSHTIRDEFGNVRESMVINVQLSSEPYGFDTGPTEYGLGRDDLDAEVTLYSKAGSKITIAFTEFAQDGDSCSYENYGRFLGNKHESVIVESIMSEGQSRMFHVDRLAGAHSLQSLAGRGVVVCDSSDVLTTVFGRSYCKSTGKICCALQHTQEKPDIETLPACATTQYGCCPDGNSAATGENHGGCGAGCPFKSYGCCPGTASCPAGKHPECAQTRYGCCWDGATTTTGPNQAGCPPRPCVSTPHGCCPDGKTAASGPDGQGCVQEDQFADPGFLFSDPGLPCAETEFGCCRNGVDAAAGDNDEGCVMGCPGVTYGCCPDDADCTDQHPACATTRGGCCWDGETTVVEFPYEGCPPRS